MATFDIKHVKDHDLFIGSWWREAKREVKECACLLVYWAVGRGLLGFALLGFALYNIDCNHL